jgi:uncharacterized membrane protein YphA (DoxX/SURF4 family)
MKTHPIEAAAIAAVAIGRLARAAAVPLVALALTVAGYRPAPAAPAAVASAAPMVPDRTHVAGLPVAVATPAAALTVVQLRQLARAAGHRALARSGRRADLLAVLALA